jgi:hypothetical protein
MRKRQINDRDRLQRMKGELNIVLFPIPQLVRTVRSYSFKDRRLWLTHQQTHNFKLWSLGDELNHSQVVVPQSSLIVNMLRESSRPLDHFKWKDRISGAKRVENSNTQIWIVGWKDRISKDGGSLDLNQGKAASQTDRAIDLRS